MVLSIDIFQGICIKGRNSSIGGLKFVGPEQGTCEVPIVIIMIIRARAGNLQGPYCISNDSLFIYFPLSKMIAFFTA